MELLLFIGWTGIVCKLDRWEMSKEISGNLKLRDNQQQSEVHTRTDKDVTALEPIGKCL